MDEMSDTTTSEALPTYPMERASGCPFDPPPGLRTLQAEGGISKVRLWDGTAAWMITSHELERDILRDERVSVERERPGYPFVDARSRARFLDQDPAVWKTFLHMDNPDHQDLRRMITGDFRLRRMEELRPRIQKIVDDLIDDMVAKGGTLDLVEEFALPVPSLVICELLGVPYEDRDVFQRCSKVFVDRTTSFEQLVAATTEFNEYVSGLVARRHVDPGDDMVSRLVVEQVLTGKATDADVVSTAQLLLFAGHETTANMIALGTLALLRNPKELARVRDSDDPKVTANAVEELLRYLSIVHIGRGRVALEDIEIAGHRIEAGDGIIIAEPIANRDPAVFDNPDELDVSRDARRHIAFGYGVHQCLGQPLARVELQVVLDTLFRRLPDLALAIDFADVDFKDEAGIYGVHSLPVTF